MKDCSIYLAACVLIALTACQKEIMSPVGEGSDQRTEFSIQATLGAFDNDLESSGPGAETKAVANAVVRLNWAAGDKLSAINLTTGKALGGDLSTNEAGPSSLFSGTLIGTINPGDQIAFLYPSQGYTEEQDFSGATIDFTEQDGSSAVPLAVYGTVRMNGNMAQGMSIDFQYLMSYFQINLTDLPASESIDYMRFPGMGAMTTLTINGSRSGFVSTPQDAAITVSSTKLASNDRGAKAIYLSGFASASKPERRAIQVATENSGYVTTWTGSSLGVGRYYTSIVTGFNEAVFFEDDNFKEFCLGNYDRNRDGELSMEEALNIYYLSLNTDDVESIVGIRFFKNLRSLSIGGMAAKWSADGVNVNVRYGDSSISDALPVVKGVSASGRIASIDLRGLANLASLNVFRDNVESINLEGCASLTNVSFTYSSISSLDLGTLENLTSISFNYSNIENLDVSRNAKLASIYIYNAFLTDLDVSGNAALTSLSCSSCELSSLDVSKNAALTSLTCSRNQLSSIDVSGNAALTFLDCYGNQISSLDLSGNTALSYLNCSNNPLARLDVSKNTALTTLYCTQNQLSSLDLSQNTVLAGLSCSGNQLTALDVTKNTALVSLYCSDNQLAGIDVTKNTVLTDLSCSNNLINGLDLSKNQALKYLSCDMNQLKSLDLSNNHDLERLYCSRNQLSSLDLSNNPSLLYLSCYSNLLTSLDLSGNPDLISLTCFDNSLTSLDISKTDIGGQSSGFLDCAPMPSLKSLTLADGWSIQNINYYRSENYIPENTLIQYAKMWKDLGTATYTEVFLAGFFDGIENVTYEVEIQESISAPGKYRLKNPYGAAYPYNTEGSWDDSRDYYMVIDARDPDNVSIPMFETGLLWGNKISLASSNALFSSSSSSTPGGHLENGVITFPQNSLFTGIDNGYRYSSNAPDFRLVLPGASSRASLTITPRKSGVSRTLMPLGDAVVSNPVKGE